MRGPRIGEMCARAARAAWSGPNARNTAAGASAAIASSLVALITYPLSLHHLGPSAFGLWLLITTPLTVVQINNIGFSPALGSLIANDHAARDYAGVAAHLTNALLLMLTAAAVGITALGFGAPYLARILRIPASQTPAFVLYQRLIGLVVSYALIVEVFNAVLAGAQRFDLAVRNSIAGQLAGLIAMFGFLTAGMKLSALLAGSALSYMVMHALTMRELKRLGLLKVDHAVDIARMRALLSYGKTVALASLLGVAVAPMNRFCLSRCGGLSAISQLDSAFLPSTRLRSVIDCGLRPYYLRASYLAGAPRRRTSAELRRVEKKTLIVFGLGSLALFGGGIALARPALNTWLGKSFDETIVCPFRLCLAGALMTSLTLPAQYTLLAVRKTTLCIGIASIVPVVHALVLTALFAMRKRLSPSDVATSIALACAAQSAVLLGHIIHCRTGRVRQSPGAP